MADPLKQVWAKQIGQNIQKARKRANLEQQELAGLADISRTSLSNLETGKHIPTVQLLIRLCRRLGISTSQAFEGIDPSSISLAIEGGVLAPRLIAEAVLGRLLSARARYPRMTMKDAQITVLVEALDELLGEGYLQIETDAETQAIVGFSVS